MCFSSLGIAPTISQNPEREPAVSERVQSAPVDALFALLAVV